MSVYDEVDIEDMNFNSKEGTFTYQCPCGDLFVISIPELLDGEDIAICPSCSLLLRVVYEKEWIDKKNEQWQHQIMAQ